MGTDKTIFVEVVRGGTTGSYVTGSDVSHVTGSDASHVTGKDRKYVLRMPDFPLRFSSYYSSSTECVIAHNRYGYRQ